MTGTTVKRFCGICQKHHKIELTPAESDRFARWQNREMHIQDAFPTWNATDREFLQSGLCPACQPYIFGDSEPSERITAVA